MKPRHSAALVLVGWYLMVPPMYEHQRIDENVPLSEWKVMDSFDTAAECNDFLTKVRTTITDPKIAKRVMFSACIEPDDPRLKGK